MRGQTIYLQRQDVEVVGCEECGHDMVNLDANELMPGDLLILKRKGIRVSNPETDNQLCEHCEHKESDISRWYDNDDDDDNDFFTYPSTYRTPTYSSPSISIPSFRGFGGGGFSGGGASRGF